MITNTVTTIMSAVSPITPKRGAVITTQDQNDFVDSFEATTDQFSNNVEPEINNIGDEINTVIGEINSTVADVNNYAISAAADALLAAGAANNKGSWSLLTGSLSIPSSVNHNGSMWILNLNIADVTASEPTPVNTDWTESSGVTQQELDLKRDISDSYSIAESDNFFNLKNSKFGIDVGAANAIQINNVDYESYFDGMIILFTPVNENTGATTLKVKTLLAKNAFYNGVALVAGFLNINYKYIAVYDLTNDRFNIDTIVNNRYVSDNVMIKSETELTNIDTLFTRGTFRSNAGATGNPEALSVYSILVYGRDQGNLTTQLATDQTGENTYIRTYVSSWSAWTSLASPIGANQTWQNLFTSRSAGVTYTNTTGKAIMVVPGVLQSVSGGCGLEFFVDGVSVAQSKNEGTSTNSRYNSVQIIVPNGSTYSMSVDGGVYFKWFELR